MEMNCYKCNKQWETGAETVNECPYCGAKVLNLAPSGDFTEVGKAIVTDLVDAIQPMPRFYTSVRHADDGLRLNHCKEVRRINLHRNEIDSYLAMTDITKVAMTELFRRQKSLPKCSANRSGTRNPCRSVRRTVQVSEILAEVFGGLFRYQKSLPKCSANCSATRNPCRSVRQTFLDPGRD